MKNLISLSKVGTLLVSGAVLLFSCKNGSIFKKAQEKSSVTGWTYNDPTGSGFRVSKEKEQQTGPGLVFVEGGTITLGASEEDPLYDWNNISKRVTVSSFYMDETEVANVHYREYLFWLNKVFNDTSVTRKALPDTLCWRAELGFNDPMVEFYFRHPTYNLYPVVGVSWRQASDFCMWRTDRVNEKLLWDRKITNQKAELQKQIDGTGKQENFNTKSYLLGLYNASTGKGIEKFKDPRAKGQKPTAITMEDGIILPDYRLPTEAEWEYAAYGYIAQNPNPRKNEKRRGEELTANKQKYPWAENVNGLRDDRQGSWQGQFMANFKRGSGDNAGVAGGSNDRAVYTNPIKAFIPNGFGLYNMGGNVSEWVMNVYRPLTSVDAEDVNPFRGNQFKTFDLTNGAPDRDDMGRVKMRAQTVEELADRRNYQQSDVRNFLDGDATSKSDYLYGVTTLVSDSTRVVKGGSWNDRAYWMSPGTRRHLEEWQSSSTIGFRCAMDRLGSHEGNGRRTGNWFSNRRQNQRKR